MLLCNSVSALFPNKRFPNKSLYSTVCLVFFQHWKSLVQCCVAFFSLFFRSHHNWKEVGGRVLPAGFFPPQRLPVDIQTHKHLTLLVPPHRWCVGVVAVLLDPLLQGAVNTKLSLKQDSKCRLITLLNARMRQNTDDFSCTSIVVALGTWISHSFIYNTCFDLCALAETKVHFENCTPLPIVHVCAGLVMIQSWPSREVKIRAGLW